MKFSEKLFILALIFGFCFGKSQVAVHKLVSAGYVYQNQSFGEIGGKLLFLTNDDFIFRIGASALMGETNSEFAIMPKVQADVMLNFERNVDMYHSWYFLVGAELTNKYAAPKLGLSILGLIDLTAGYGFSIDKKGLKGKELKGLNVGVTLNIPTVMIHDLLN